MIVAARLLLSLIFLAAADFNAKAGAPISFIGYKNPSAPIFSKAGPTVINYQLYDEYAGIHKPGGGLTEEGFVMIAVRDSNRNLLYSYPVQSSTGVLGTTPGPHLLTTGSFQFLNPSSQDLIVEEQIWYTRPLEGVAGFPSQEWSSGAGQSLVSGGDNPGGTVGGGGGGTGTSATTSIHAVIISGRSDPAKIVTSPNVTLTGGVVALGRDPSPPPTPATPWSKGLRILPDQALLTGAKIPPLTPTIIDVRIAKHEVVGDLVAPNASPSP